MFVESRRGCRRFVQIGCKTNPTIPTLNFYITLLESARNRIIASFHWIMTQSLELPVFSRESRNISPDMFQDSNLSISQNRLSIPNQRVRDGNKFAYHNQMFLQRQFPKITLGRFKGMYDYRRLRCYKRECRLRTTPTKCSYCSHLPYFPSPLRQCYFPQDFQTIEFMEINSESESDLSESEMDTDESFTYIKNERSRHFPTESDRFPVEIELYYLLTEINEIIVTNENQDLNTILNTESLTSSSLGKPTSHPKLSIYPKATTKQDNTNVLVSRLRPMSSITSKGSTKSKPRPRLRGSKSSEFWNKLGFMWNFKKNT